MSIRQSTRRQSNEERIALNEKTRGKFEQRHLSHSLCVIWLSAQCARVGPLLFTLFLVIVLSVSILSLFLLPLPSPQEITIGAQILLKS